MNIELKAEFNPVVWFLIDAHLLTAASNAHLNLNLQLSAIFFIFFYKWT